MTEEISLLDEFNVDKPKKGKYFDLLIASSVSYIIFIIVDFAFDTKRLSIKSIDWELAIGILFLPVLGLVFHVTSKKIGWIINFFYYLLFCCLAASVLLKNLFEGNLTAMGKLSWRGYLLFLLTLASAAILFSKSLRKYFRISTLLLLIISVISIGLAVLMYFFIIAE